MTTISELKNTYDRSTMKNNTFEKYIKKNAVQSYEDDCLCFEFSDGTYLTCDSLDPFKLSFAEVISPDMSLVFNLKQF